MHIGSGEHLGRNSSLLSNYIDQSRGRRRQLNALDSDFLANTASSGSHCELIGAPRGASNVRQHVVAVFSNMWTGCPQLMARAASGLNVRIKLLGAVRAHPSRCGDT